MRPGSYRPIELACQTGSVLSRNALWYCFWGRSNYFFSYEVAQENDSKLVPHSSIRRNTDPVPKANKRPARLFINPRRFPLKNGVRLIHFCSTNVIIWEVACSKRSDGSHAVLRPLAVFRAHFALDCVHYMNAWNRLASHADVLFACHGTLPNERSWGKNARHKPRNLCVGG